MKSLSYKKGRLVLKIDVYTVCKNEAKIAPFIVDYWKTLVEDTSDLNVYVYDEFSDDGTREYLSQFSFIHIIDVVSNGLNDSLHNKIKENEWRKSIGKADLVIVCDFDEALASYSTEELRKTLKEMIDGGYDVAAPLSFNIVADSFPEYDGRLLHEICKYGDNDAQWYAKPILFNPNNVTSMNYVLGCHCARPSANGRQVKWYHRNDLFLVHCKFLGRGYYFERINNRKLSDWNINHGLFAEKDRHKDGMEEEYNEHIDKRFLWDDIKENFDEFYKTKQDWTLWGLGRR